MLRHALLACLLIVPCACRADGPATDAGVVGTTSTRAVPAETSATIEIAGLYALPADTLEGQPAPLDTFAGRVSLVVNVASECGYTKQYVGLQQLHERLSERGFQVLGFPSNEFGGQEPGGPEEIRAFCSANFGVTFPLFAKCRTQPGEGQSPVYAFLEGQTDSVPAWNFCKYLVGRDGQVLAFFPSKVTPDDPEFLTQVEQALDADHGPRG